MNKYCVEYLDKDGVSHKVRTEADCEEDAVEEMRDEINIFIHVGEVQ